MTDEQKNMLISNNFDVAGTLSRFMNKEELYEKFLLKFIDDNNYEGLIKSFEEKNYENAYMHTHTLKGVAGNLGISGVFDDTVQILEKLKYKKYEETDELLNSLTKNYNSSIEAIKSLLK